MSLYRKVFNQSIKATLTNKYLWFFGFFATLFSGSIELDLFNGIISRTNFLWQVGKFNQTGIFSSNFFENLKAVAMQDGFISGTVIVLIIFLVMIAVVIVFSVVSQVAIVNNTANYLNKDEVDSFKIGIKSGVNNFWPVTWLNVAVKIIAFVILTLIFLPLIATINNPSFFTDGLFIVGFVVLVMLAIVIAFVVKYIVAYVVVYQQKLTEAIPNAWKLFKNNWLVSGEMAFMLLLINIVGTLAILLIIFILMIPLSLLISAAVSFDSVSVYFIALGLRFLVSLAVFIVGGSILTTFNVSTWTALFLKLNKGGGESKIMRTIHKF